MDITQDRLNVIRQVHGINIRFNVVDKSGADGNSLGTMVVIKLEQDKE
jgi:hypothetical protein